MKNIKSIVLTVVLMLGTLTASAQTKLTQLTSKSLLRGYAVEIASQASSSAYCNSQMGPTPADVITVFASNHTSKDIINFFTSSVKNITIANTNDYVWINGEVKSANGDRLFHGYGYGFPKLGKGGYGIRVPFMLELNGIIPVRFDQGVNSAYMKYVDPITGQTTYGQQFGVNGSTVYFHTDSAGSGFLITNMKDGTERTYDIRTGGSGALTQGTGVTVEIESAAIRDFKSFTDPGLASALVQSYDGTGENPTLELILTRNTNVTNSYTTFDIETTEGARPTGFYVRKKGQPLDAGTEYPTIQTPGSSFGKSSVPLPIGIYYITPIWNSIQFRQPEPNMWHNTGKG